MDFMQWKFNDIQSCEVLPRSTRLRVKLGSAGMRSTKRRMSDSVRVFNLVARLTEAMWRGQVRNQEGELEGSYLDEKGSPTRMLVTCPRQTNSSVSPSRQPTSP